MDPATGEVAALRAEGEDKVLSGLIEATKSVCDLKLGEEERGEAGSKGKGKLFVPPKDWANAPEFVPRSFVPAPEESKSGPVKSGETPRSYADVVGVGASVSSHEVCADAVSELCPFAYSGECRFGTKCMDLHGLKCEFCGLACLHPYCPEQREKHYRECVAQHEQDMELSFAIARSKDKTCGICMEVIIQKSPAGEQRFGILPSCNHCFCLSCIRKWRQAKQFENKIIRACPECRVTSDYVCPSRHWVETKEEKEKLIKSYRDSLSKKHCRYYKNGSGECPFGNKCFYLHADAAGRHVDVGPPRRRIRRQNANGTASDSQSVSIWEFMEQWELQWFEIEDLMMDSDDTSLWSDDDDDFELGGAIAHEDANVEADDSGMIHIHDCEAFLFANQTNRFPVVSPYPGLTINEILAMANRLPIPPEHRPDIVWGWDSDSDSD